jgi:hypothetical protein
MAGLFILLIHWLISEIIHQLHIKSEHKLKGTSKIAPWRGLSLHPLLLPQWVSLVGSCGIHFFSRRPQAQALAQLEAGGQWQFIILPMVTKLLISQIAF